MNRKHINRIVTVAAVTAAATLASQALAVPVNGFYVEDQRCDPVPSQSLSHELGEVQFFPINESLQIFVSPTTNYICVPDDGIQNDWTVQIINVSGQAWTNLFFVADLGLSIGNADGTAYDTAPLPGAIVDAFRIDGTVTVTGMNDNLLGESGVVDEILSPGESWRFVVTNYFDPAGSAPPPLFRVPGVFANTEPFMGAASIGTANILANPIPEPTTVGLFTAAGIALLLRRPRR